MKEIQFPKITLTVEARPWPANHVARVLTPFWMKTRRNVPIPQPKSTTLPGANNSISFGTIKDGASVL